MVKCQAERAARAVFITAGKPEHVGEFHAVQINGHRSHSEKARPSCGNFTQECIEHPLIEPSFSGYIQQFYGLRSEHRKWIGDKFLKRHPSVVNPCSEESLIAIFLLIAFIFRLALEMIDHGVLHWRLSVCLGSF